MTTEQIGKVKVNLTDCVFEKNKSALKEDLLRTVRDHSVLEYRSIIEERLSYDFIYHLSPVRGNVVRWLPIKESDSVLEINAECGAITSALFELSENITTICDCATDAEILAERFSNCKGFVIYAGALSACLSQIEGCFDWIIVRNAEYLRDLKRLLSPLGRIVFICDNRMGMRNLAGVKADGSDVYFAGVEGKTDSGFTFAGLRKLLAVSGFNKAQMFYPYPDYRFMRNLYSNTRLPRTGELTDNYMNLDSDRLEVFCEKDAFDASCEDGSFQYYSNSYLMIIGDPVETEYARFSNERAPEYEIYTTIENRNGSRIVAKHPLTKEAEWHIRNMSKYYTLLCERYAGSKLRINKCNLMETGNCIAAHFDFVHGVELSRLMDLAISKNDLDGFYCLFDKYVSLTGYNQEYPFADLDIVFSNIIVDGDEWTLIDYEWCKEGKLSVKESAYRAIYCYLLEDKNRGRFNMDLIRSKLVLSKEASDEIEADEILFQERVNGKRLTIKDLRRRLGVRTVNPVDLAVMINDNSGIYRFRVYPGGSSQEFSEETSYFIEDAYKSENIAEAVIAVGVDDTVIRIDPLDSPCLVTVRNAMLGEAEFPVENKKYLVSNGKRAGENTFVFSTSDPNLYFDLRGFIHDEDTFLYVKLEIYPLPEDTASNVEKSIKKLF